MRDFIEAYHRDLELCDDLMTIVIEHRKGESTYMIKPSIGRVVWFWQGVADQTQPLAAIITYVWDDTRINLALFSVNGDCTPRQHIYLWDGNGDRPYGEFAEWMPFQKGQAMKTEQLEKQLQDRS